jgi:serine/threonine-protein kinase HipA
MKLAKILGLNVPEIRLAALDEIEGLPQDLPALRADEPRTAYVIRRFDRPPDGERLHFEDLNQVADQAPDEKYDNKTTSWVANVIATLCPSEDLDEFVRRLVFGVCTGNNDMHLKNWAIVYPDGYNARIAPLYDFVCSLLYYPRGTLALTIGGAREFNEVDEGALRAFARAAEISERRIVILANDVVDQLRATWPDFRRTVDDEDLVDALEENFARLPLMNVARRVAGTKRTD